MAKIESQGGGHDERAVCLAASIWLFSLMLAKSAS